MYHERVNCRLTIFNAWRVRSMERDMFRVVGEFNEVLNDLESIEERMTPKNRNQCIRFLRRMKNRLVLMQDEVRYGNGRNWDSENRGNKLDLSELCGEDAEGESPAGV
jgi:hypothetical protein